MNFDWDSLNVETEPIERKNYTPIPDGVYLVNVEKAEIKVSKEKLTPSLNLTLKVIEGPHKGRVVFKPLWLTENNLKYVNADLRLFEYTKKVSDLQNPETLEFFLDKKVSVFVKTREDGEYTNTDVFINSVIPESEMSNHDDCVQELTPEDADKIPF